MNDNPAVFSTDILAWYDGSLANIEINRYLDSLFPYQALRQALEIIEDGGRNYMKLQGRVDEAEEEMDDLNNTLQDLQYKFGEQTRENKDLEEENEKLSEQLVKLQKQLDNIKQPELKT